jgi:molybdopterin/thiamine biosynthesis adenylyltransferase/proteasome lid subunit RPN8/RPN11
MTTLAIADELWDELRAPLQLDVETAAVILARPAEGAHQTLLARRVVWVPDDAYQRREQHALEITSHGYVPALKDAADDGAVAIFFHTHPDGEPEPSSYDDEVDAGLRGPFQLRTGQPLYASLILGGRPERPRFSGRVWNDVSESALDRVRVAGARLQLLTRNQADVSDDLFDRQIRAFGREGQRLLRSLRVGIVGAGGTGSAVFEQVVRLGVGEITVIDDDLLTQTNLTRIHESAMSQLGEAKVAIAEQAAREIGLRTTVRAIESRITELAAARALVDCDVVFGCTDDNRGRAILSRLAYWYLIPVVDTAFLVDVADGSVRGLFGRVTVVAPGTACLFCRNRIDSQQLAAEALPDDERARLAAEGYVPGLGQPDPSVGAYTTLTGTLAVTELLDRLFGLSGDDPPTELLVRVHDRAISTTRVSPQPEHYCGQRHYWGRGDTDPFLEQLWG